MSLLSVQVVFKKINELGEGPIYDERSGTLFWVDIAKKRIYFKKLSAQGFSYVQLEEPVSAVFLTEGKEVLASAGHSIYLVEPSASPKKISELEEERGLKTRFNDGKVSPEGLLVVGTMDLDEREPIGSLYSFDGKSFKRILSGTTISNGLAWDVKRKLFYFIDSPTKKVNAYEYGKDMSLRYIGEAADLSEEAGVPDGMTIDADGMIWVAVWGGGKVVRFDPLSGKKLLELHVPAEKTSSCAFGGESFRYLFITSASSENDLGGSLFVAETEYQGLPSFRFDLKRLK